MKRRSSRSVSGVLACALALPIALLASACESAPPRPANDDWGAAARLTATAQGRVSGTTLGAVLQPGEDPELGTHSVWYRWVAPESGVVSFTTVAGLLGGSVQAYTGSSFRALRPVSQNGGFDISAFRVTAGTTYTLRVVMTFGGSFALGWKTATTPANDNRQRAAALSTGSGSVAIDTSAATRQPSDPTIDGERIPASVWYRWTAPGNGWYAFDTSGSSASAVLGVYADDAAPTRINDSSGSCGAFGLSTSFGFPSTPGATVGFQAQAGRSYLLMLGTAPEAFPDLSSGRPIPVVNQFGASLQLNWRLEPGAATVGANDVFAQATKVSGTHGMVDGTTVGATAQAGEPAHDGKPAQASVWYSWTPPMTADYVLQALPNGGAGCSSRVAVYSGTAVNTLTAAPVSTRLTPLQQLTRLQSLSEPSDSIDGTVTSAYAGERVHLVGGRTYHIAVDELGEQSPFALRWDIPQAPPVVRSVTVGNASIGVIWAPPPTTAGSARSGYYVTAIPVTESDDDGSDAISDGAVPVTSSFTTIRGLTNGKAYRLVLAAVNDGGPGDLYVSAPVTPHR